MAAIAVSSTRACGAVVSNFSRGDTGCFVVGSVFQMVRSGESVAEYRVAGLMTSRFVIKAFRTKWPQFSKRRFAFQ